jgi:cyclopropane fatty-acyl-phospholipid synthase-like methyltransferase
MPGDASPWDASALFDQQSAYWSEVYRDAGVDGVIYRDRQARVLRFLDDLRLGNDARVLELGPGAGMLSQELVKRGHAVQSIDSSRAMVDRCRDLRGRIPTAAATKWNITQGDAHHLDSPAESFEAVIAVGVTPWLHSPADALAEMRRVLTPRGHIVLTSDNSARATFVLDPRRNPTVVRAAKEIDRVLVQCGFPTHRRPEAFPVRRRISEIDELLRQCGLHVRRRSTVGFGPFTFCGRNVLSASSASSVRMHRTLQRRADRGVPLLRNGGAHYVVLAQRLD